MGVDENKPEKKDKPVRFSKRLRDTLMKDKLDLGFRSMEKVVWFFRKQYLNPD